MAAPDVVEAARKRAVLAAEIARYHFRLLSAVGKAAAYAHRIGDLEEASSLDDQYLAIEQFSRQVSSAADDTHAYWDGLRRARDAS